MPFAKGRQKSKLSCPGQLRKCEHTCSHRPKRRRVYAHTYTSFVFAMSAMALSSVRRV